MIGFNTMHIWQPIEKKLEFDTPSLNHDVAFLGDFKCSMCGLVKYHDSDESKLRTCEEQICRIVLEEDVISFKTYETIGVGYVNSKGITKFKI